MTYEYLTILVVLNVVVTLALLTKASNQTKGRPKLKKKAAKALWRSDPVTNKSDPPKVAGGEFSSLAYDVDRRFFADFRDFADVTNWWLGDDFVESRFRLQDPPYTDLRLNRGFLDGPVLGRAFAIYYNQTSVGSLEIRPSQKYRAEFPEVLTSLEIDWARFFSYEALAEFLGAIAHHVTSDEDYTNAMQSMQTALTRTLWGNYRVSMYDSADVEDWGELTVSFHGTAFFYIDRRDAPARPR
jgi:hypothetical protein